MEEKDDEHVQRVSTGVGRYSRNRSIMSLTNNPFEAAAASVDLNVEILTDAVVISEDNFNDIILGPLKTTSDNEERLSMLAGLKQPYLFSSAQLLSLCNLTTSLKTKMAFVQQIAPRLIDPSSSTGTFTDMFRFVEEKLQIEQMLKDRSTTLSKAQLTNVRRSSNILASRTGGRGGGGAGRGNRASVTGGDGSSGRSASVGGGSSDIQDNAGSSSEETTSASASASTSASGSAPSPPPPPAAPVTSPASKMTSIFGCVSDVDSLANDVDSACTVEK